MIVDYAGRQVNNLDANRIFYTAACHQPGDDR